MPLLNGPELVRIVRSPGVFPLPDIAIIMLTVSDEDDDLYEAIKAGANSYLLKEVSVEEVPEEEPVQVDEDMYLPIAAEAEAASRAITQSPGGAIDAEVETPEMENPANLPAEIEPSGEVEPHDERGTQLIPSIPDATRAAARWIRPLVPPFVARVIDNTTQPLRTARQVF